MNIISDILNWLTEVWEEYLKFWYVVRDYEGCVVLRLGTFHKQPLPGFHWKLPGIDEVLTCQIATETITVASQSLTTADGQNIVLGAVVKCNISDPVTYLLKVKDVSSAISDITQGKIKSIVMTKTWEECRGDLDGEISKAVKGEASKWGVKVQFVTITDLALIKTIRLIQN
jgi:regulator of protease activity HflC (stomatin/prohibitin superfamily)